MQIYIFIQYIMYVCIYVRIFGKCAILIYIRMVKKILKLHKSLKAPFYLCYIYILAFIVWPFLYNTIYFYIYIYVYTILWNAHIYILHTFIKKKK